MESESRDSESVDGALDEPEEAQRRVLTENARERWIKRLIDVSRRNNLLYYRDLKKGTLDLGELASQILDRLLSGDVMTLHHLRPEDDQDDVGARAQEIRRRAISNEEEKGLQTLFLAIGMATWAMADGGRPPEAPILLVPVSITNPGSGGRSAALRREGELQVNLALLHVLETLGCSVTEESLRNADVTGDEGEPSIDRETALDLEVVFSRLRAATSEVPGFAITRRVVLGNFSFQKMAMVKDLRERGEEMAAHDLIAALAGDHAARAILQKDRRAIDVRELDTIPPQTEHLVLDADSSQQAVIQAVLEGQSGVIQGPPGTGKSQTIANLIAALVGAGKSVLFVAEKRAALEVVLHRLESVGLDRLVLDLYRADISRKALMQQLATGLDQARSAPPVDGNDLHQSFVDRRQRLNAHDSRLHAAHPPSGKSAYDLMGSILRIPPAAQTHRTRWRGDDLQRLDAQTATNVHDLLVEAAGFGTLFFGDSPSPWANAPISDGTQVQMAADLVYRLHDEHWPKLQSALERAVEATGLPMPRTLGDVAQAVTLLCDIADLRALYNDGIFRVDLALWATSLAPSTRWFLPKFWATIFNGDYRETKTKARALRTDGKATTAQIYREVLAATDQLSRWRARTNPTAMPVAYAEAQELRRFLEEFLTDLRSLAPLLHARHGLANPADLTLDALGILLDNLADDKETPYRLPRIHEIRTELERAGAGRILDELRSGGYDPALWAVAFDHARLSSCLDQLRADDPSLAGFNGRTHENFVQEFVDLDAQRIRLAADRIRRAHAERVIEAFNANPEQANLLQREVRKRSRHLPLRSLLGRAPDVLTAVRPCWMASPLAVSQLIGADRHYFDIVIFDEASQVLPEDAAPALLRAPRAVVAGDRHQLPPTTFFASSTDDEESEISATSGFESILDVMESVFAPPWRLEWHYRSRDEALIAFSNQEIYHRGLITFPGRGGEETIRHILVDTEDGRDGQEISPAEEVLKVVDLIIAHAEEHPNESLGVITLGIEHANRVQAAFDRAIVQRPDLADFFDESKPDRFFVKNLERVQGDERDAIILSIGCGKDRAGRIRRTQFGPLNSKDVGRRRLNVAVTRARQRMTVVSAFTHGELGVSATGDTGTDLLQKYLEYAKSGGRRLSTDGPTTERPNPFELDVQETLEQRGMKLRAQWGVSSYRIDLVAEHPEQAGRFVLAIECDGASYHSAPTARDRDRLRQQHLEALGWRFHRIWSTDWFMRRDDEIARAVSVYKNAIVHSSARNTTSPVESAREKDTIDGELAFLSSSVPTRRKSRPPITHHDQISQFTPKQIESLIEWLQSDGQLRTDEEIVTLMVSEPGFKRRGPKIEQAIRAAIQRLRVAGKL